MTVSITKNFKIFYLVSFKRSILLLMFFSLFSCQDVVEVDLETGKERLVIEALIKWQTNTTGNNQIIKLSKTSSFYNNQIIPATNATVVIKNLSDTTEFIFTETQDGLYQSTNFIPVIDNDYELTIVYQNEIYKAKETLLEAPEILSLYQSTEEGFSTDEPEINIIFQDFEDQTDYYKIGFTYFKPIPPTNTEYELEDNFSYVFNDRFQENNPISIFYENEEFEANDLIKVQLQAISKQFYHFLVKIEEQTNSGFGPFSLPPINVKGNVVNTTNNDHYPYGYFSLNEVKTEDYIFQ